MREVRGDVRVGWVDEPTVGYLPTGSAIGWSGGTVVKACTYLTHRRAILGICIPP